MWLRMFNGLYLGAYLYKGLLCTLVNHPSKSNNTEYYLFFVSSCFIYFFHFILLLLCNLGEISFTIRYQHVALTWEQNQILIKGKIQIWFQLISIPIFFSILMIFCISSRFCFFYKNIKVENYEKIILKFFLKDLKKFLTGFLN